MMDVVLKKGKEKSLLRRHPWVYDTAVARVSGQAGPGDLVRVVSNSGLVLGIGGYSPASSLRVRMWTFNEAEDVASMAFLQNRLEQAVRARENLLQRTTARRLVFAEADGLPGLVVDQYDAWLVTQFQSAAVEVRREAITSILMQLTGAKGVFDRSDAATRQREGLVPHIGVLAGSNPPERIEVVEDGVRYGVDVRKGHKTGFYIDQRESRLAVQRLAREFREKNSRGLRALNCFCYTGGFSLALMAGGADSVDSVDSSADALAQARANAKLNRLPESALNWIEADVFEYLRKAREAGKTYDLVILDPPKFASSHYHVERAARAYKDINLNGMRLLREGGHLMSFSCSGAVDVDLFQKILAGAVFDAGKDVWAVERFGAGADHPLLMTYPEGEYLKGMHLLMRSDGFV